MARLPYVDPAEAPEEVRKTLERLPLSLNIFRTMAHASTNFRPLIALGTSILSQQALSPLVRELAILQTAKRTGAQYEWVQHVPIAKIVGATDAQIAALEVQELESEVFSAAEKAALGFATELLSGFDASDAAFDRLRAHFSAREIVELILATGYYLMLGLLMKATRIDLDPASGDQILRSIQDRK